MISRCCDLGAHAYWIGSSGVIRNGWCPNLARMNSDDELPPLLVCGPRESRGLQAAADCEEERSKPGSINRPASGRRSNVRMVPLAGIEPALLAELDFESSASTSSATGAFAFPRPKQAPGGEAGGL